MIDKKISRQLKIALKESNFMLNTLVRSQSKINTVFTLTINENGKSKNILNQINEARESFVFNLPYLLFYSYHYIYDLHSITEILKHFKSTNLISIKKEIELFREKIEVKKITEIKNNRIHNKNKDLITMSFQNDKFIKRYIFCELPIEYLGEGTYKYNHRNFKLTGNFKEIITNTNIARVNLRTKEKLEIYSIYGFLKQLLDYGKIFDNFYSEVLKIRSF